MIKELNVCLTRVFVCTFRCFTKGCAGFYSLLCRETKSSTSALTGQSFALFT
ncbi:unnamed protein product, partial [Staurois parvus]